MPMELFVAPHERPRERPVSRDVRHVVQEILAFRDREGPTLGGQVTIRGLIDEGRRF